MSYIIYWTEESKFTLNKNLEYLSKEWDLLAINNFLDRVDEVTKAICQNPNLYPIYRKSDQVHKCVVNRHITLFYRIATIDRVDLITFWNTHLNPESLKV